MTSDALIRKAIVEEARSWIGTPYKHQQHKKGQSCDCIGLIIGVGTQLGFIEDTGKIYNYPRTPNGFSLRENCENKLRLLSPSAPTIGSIVLFWLVNPNYPQHLGILSDRGNTFNIIHAYQPSKRVIETSLDALWTSKIVGFYDYRF